MSSDLKVFGGWVLCVAGFFTYLYLWITAYHYISEKLGSEFTIILLFFTNIIGPGIYIVWTWIDSSFPAQYFFIWMGALIVSRIGMVMVFDLD